MFQLVKYIMLPGDIHTIQDFIAYCREVLAERPEYMREKEQERCAAAIVGIGAYNVFEELQVKYPQFTEIYDLASDLEISNTANTTIDWRRIKELVSELEREVVSADPSNS